MTKSMELNSHKYKFMRDSIVEKNTLPMIREHIYLFAGQKIFFSVY